MAGGQPFRSTNAHPNHRPSLVCRHRVGTAVNPNPRGPAQLRTSASNSLECKIAFLGVDNNNRSFVISRYHELQASLGSPSALAGHGYSTSKDLRADGGTVTVEPDDTFMNLARNGTAIVVPTLASLRQQLAANPPAEAEWTTGPHAAGDADTDCYQASLGDARSLAAADLMWIGFFFLGRPGEYTAASDESTPFRACDVTLFHDATPCLYESATDEAIDAANFVTNEFTEQKNSVRGEVIGHGPTTSTTACPVAATKRRFHHLRQHNAPAVTNLCAYFQNGNWNEVKSTDITTLLRQAASELPQYNLLPSDVSARSLRASGAMALLCKQVDTDLIRLMGRWRSDEMLRYLHLQAQPVMHGFAEKMLQGGDYSLLPSAPDQSLPTVPVA